MDGWMNAWMDVDRWKGGWVDGEMGWLGGEWKRWTDVLHTLMPDNLVNRGMLMGS